MNDNDLVKKLETAKPPQIHLPEKQAALRRELLDQPQFRKTPARGATPRLKFALTVLAAVSVTALILWINLQPQRTLARDLIENMHDAYTRTEMTDKVHHLRMLYRSPMQPAVERSAWIYRRGEKARFLHKDAETGEVLAHLIADGAARYALPDSKLELQFDVDFQAEHEAGAMQSGEKTEQQNLNIVLLPAPQSEGDGSQKLLQAIIMSDTFDRGEFEQQTPAEVAAALRKSENVRYLGSDIDAATGKKLDILERRAARDAPSIKLIFSQDQLETVHGFLEALQQDSVLARTTEAFFAQNHIRGEVQVKQIEIIENIAVFAQTARIHRIVLTVREDGAEIFRAEKTILQDEFLDYRPALFSPQAFGLTLQPPQARDSQTRPPGRENEQILIEQETIDPVKNRPQQK